MTYGPLSGPARRAPVNNAYFEDLTGRLYGLVIRLSDRLPAGQAQWLHHVTEVGEYGLTLEDMAGYSPTARSPSRTRSAATCWPWRARWEWMTLCRTR
jgi:hypothetical protein